MKIVQKWLTCLHGCNGKKIDLLISKYLRKKNKIQFQSIRRSSSILQSKNYNLVITSDGIIKSSYPDVGELDRHLTFVNYIWQNVDKWANHVAVECCISGQKYTYSQLRVLSKRFAESLHKQGFRQGQVLSVLLPNMPDYAVVVLGALEAGIIISPLNPVYTPYELAHQLHDNGAVIVVTLPDLLEKLSQAKALIESKEKKPCSITTIVVSYDSCSPRADNTIDFKEMIAEHVKPSRQICTAQTIDDIIALPYSSGTTGLSKGVRLTHRNLISNMNQYNCVGLRYLLPATNEFQEIIPGILPFFHIYGLCLILLRGFSLGARIVTLPKFEVDTFLTMLKNHRPTALYAVPPIVVFLGRHPKVTKDHFSSLRFILNGAGPLGTSDGERLADRTNGKVFLGQGYGLTETSPLVFVCPENEHNFSSVGVSISNTMIKVMKPDGNLASVGEHGEIWVKGPQVMQGYHNKPEATKDTIDDEKFFHTGDVAYYDEDGKFYIVDRIKELIKVKGFQVPPAELEMVLRSHSDIEDAGVIGVADEKTGEKPFAFVVKKTSSNVTEKELLEFVASRVAPFKKLGGVSFIDLVPKSPAGKILKNKLRESYSSLKP